MLNLLKADLRMFLRMRFVHILLLLCITFTVLGMLLLRLHVADLSIIGIDAKGYALLVNSYHPNNNVGLLIGIMACKLTSQEFAFGTIRNKIISGHKRWHVYLSLSLSLGIVASFFFIINVVLNGLLGSFILNYGRPWSRTELHHLIEMTGVALVLFLLFILLAIFISTLMRSAGLSIVVYFFTVLSLDFSFVLADRVSGQNPFIQDLFSFIPLYQLYRIISEGYSRSIAIKVLLISPFYYLLFLLIGMFFFERRDIK